MTRSLVPGGSELCGHVPSGHGFEHVPAGNCLCGGEARDPQGCGRMDSSETASRSRWIGRMATRVESLFGSEMILG